MEVKVELDGWWGGESAYVKRESFLYNLKMAILEELQKNKLLDEKDMTVWNKTAHIKLTDKTSAKSKEAYDKINGSTLKLTAKDIKINRNYIEINTGHSGKLQTHMTMCFRSDIGREKNVVRIVESVFEKMTKT
jgi:hypothetical protein